MKHLLVFTLIAGALAVIAGCSKDNGVTGPSAVTTDAQAVQYISQNADSVAAFTASDEYTIDDEGMQSPDFDVLAKMNVGTEVTGGVIADSSHPLRWGRRIFWNQIVRDYHVVMSGDSLAYVNLTRTVPGEFSVGWGYHSGDSVVIDSIVKKPFSEIVKRNFVFRRIAHTDNLLANWVPVAITMVDGKSNGTNKFTLTSLELSESIDHRDTNITDPLNTWFRLGWLRGTIPIVPVRDSVTVRVTVTSSDDSTELVYVRHGIGKDGLNRRRAALALVSTSGGPGSYTRVYQRTFVTSLAPFVLAERFNAVVDVFSHGTVFSKSDPFSNEFWGVPSIVARP